MDDAQVALRLAVAVALGALLGLEREHDKGGKGSAGVRTFALIALSGGLAGWLDQKLGGGVWSLALFAALAALVVAEYVLSSLHGGTGITTEVSALLAFVLGLMCAHGWLQLASTVAVVMALLLALKQGLHRLATQIDETDINATLGFGIITLIILPLVPNTSWGPPPLDALNPYKIWLMVVLISALNFASYLVIKVVGAEHGIGWVGFLGGLASSTAVTLGFARRSRQDPQDTHAIALGILLAWTVMTFRVLAMAAFIDTGLARELVLALGVLTVVNLGACYWLWRQGRTQGRAQVKSGNNPFELSEAIRFGMLFGVVIVLARAAQVYFGDAGLYLASAAAGLTDVDAITLAMADRAQLDATTTLVGARAVLLAVIANTVTKGGMALALGSPELRRAMTPAVAALLLAGLAGFVVMGA
jgi:uncharacterized membrane protein (DUF4010 family)